MNLEKENKRKEYHYLNQYAKKGQIVLTGSSLCQLFPINELQQSFDIRQTIYNRGISGFVTDELLESMEECIFDLEPGKLFINIGTNDLSKEDYTLDGLLMNYRKILMMIREKLPMTKIYVIAYYPMNMSADFGLLEEDKKSMFKTRTNAEIIRANGEVKKLAEELGYFFINVNDGLTDDNGELKEEYAMEGIHMWPNAYVQIFKNLIPYL